MILIVGGSGFIGYYLHRELIKSDNNVISTYSTNKIEEEKFIQLDVTNKNEIAKLIEKIKPNTIIYATGLTDVDICENNHKLAKSINYNGILHLASDMSISKYDFIKITLDHFNLKNPLIKASIDKQNLVAKRPKNTSLNNHKSKNLFKIEIPNYIDWLNENKILINRYLNN